MRPPLCHRRFLNRKSGTAFVEAYARPFENTRTQAQGLDAHLKIADCNRVVSLDFSLDSSSSEQARKDMKYKAEAFLKEATLFANFVIGFCKQTDDDGSR